MLAELSQPGVGGQGTAAAPSRHGAVARFEGVSAELGQPGAKLFTASDAAQALSAAPHASLKPGFQTQFAAGNHRFALRIVNREAISDQAFPDNSRLMSIVPATTANAVTFVWGTWLYTVEVEDLGAAREVVVQNVL